MNEHRHEYYLVLMCRVLRVARARFYHWLHKPLCDRAVEDQRLVNVIRNSYVASGGVYGARRVFYDLREAGEMCGKNRVERLMRLNKIKAIRGYKAPRHRRDCKQMQAECAGLYHTPKKVKDRVDCYFSRNAKCCNALYRCYIDKAIHWLFCC